MSTIYIPNSIPVKGVAFSFETGLVSQADTNVMQAAPTLAAGDVKVSIDGGVAANITALPTVIATATKVLIVTLTAAEMNGNKIIVLFSDAAGDEWQDCFIEITTNVASGNVYIPNSPMLKGNAFTFYIPFISQGDTDIFQANPTLVAGDIKVSVDDGAAANITTLPVAIATLTKVLSCTLSAAEMTGNKIVVIFSDVAGSEWQDSMVFINTESAATDSPTNGSDLTMVCGITYSTTITGLTIPATWTKIYLTLKGRLAEADAVSALQLLVSNPANPATDGITYLDGTAATVTTRAYGSLTVNQGAGSIAMLVADEGTALIPIGFYGYDIKCLVAAGTTTQLSTGGNVTVKFTETRT